MFARDVDVVAVCSSFFLFLCLCLSLCPCFSVYVRLSGEFEVEIAVDAVVVAVDHVLRLLGCASALTVLTVLTLSESGEACVAQQQRRHKALRLSLSLCGPLSVPLTLFLSA